MAVKQHNMGSINIRNQVGEGELNKDITLKKVTEVVYTNPNTIIDAANGTWQKVSLTANSALTFVLAQGQSVFVTASENGFVLDLSNVDEWVGGIAPSLGAEHALMFWSDDGVTVTGMGVGAIA